MVPFSSNRDLRHSTLHTAATGPLLSERKATRIDVGHEKIFFSVTSVTSW